MFLILKCRFLFDMVEEEREQHGSVPTFTLQIIRAQGRYKMGLSLTRHQRQYNACICQYLESDRCGKSHNSRVLINLLYMQKPFFFFKQLGQAQGVKDEVEAKHACECGCANN